MPSLQPDFGSTALVPRQATCSSCPTSSPRPHNNPAGSPATPILQKTETVYRGRPRNTEPANQPALLCSSTRHQNNLDFRGSIHTPQLLNSCHSWCRIFTFVLTHQHSAPLVVIFRDSKERLIQRINSRVRGATEGRRVIAAMSTQTHGLTFRS